MRDFTFFVSSFLRRVVFRVVCLLQRPVVGSGQESFILMSVEGEIGQR